MTSPESGNDHQVVFWSLNDYGVTVVDLLSFIIGSIIAIVIIVLNYIVLDTMLRRKSQMEPLHVMIASLALADLGNGVMLTYNLLYNIINFQIYTECLIRFGLMCGIVVTSVMHLVGQTFDRLLKIMWPFLYMRVFTVNHAVAVSVVIWMSAFMFASLPALGWNQEQSDTNSSNVTTADEPTCSYFGVMDWNYVRLLMCLCLIPFLIMIGVYVFLFKVARKHARSIAAQENQNDVNQRGDAHVWRYTKTVVIILGLYVTSWAPTGALLILVTTGSLDHWSTIEQGNFLFYFSSIGFVNSIVNPLIYAVKISAVRLRFRQVFSFGRNKNLVFDLASTHQ